MKQLGKPLILHCRDGGTGVAARNTLDMLRKHDLTQWPIHRHCFDGTPEELAQWMTDLPCCKFGFTARIFKASPELKASIARLPWSRVLLETDAPFLPPPEDGHDYQERGGSRHNNPWRIHRQAREMSILTGKPLSAVLAETSANARDLYRI